MSFVDDVDLSSIDAPRDNLNRSVDDLRKSFSSLRRSRTDVQDAREQLRASREQFLESKDEIRSSLDNTKLIRKKLKKQSVEVEMSIDDVQRKKRKLKVEIMQRYDELRKKLDASLTSSLEKLTELSDGEIISLQTHKSYIRSKIHQYDKASSRIKMKLREDEDVDIPALQRQARNLGDLEVSKKVAHFSNLFYKSHSLPIFKTEVVGPRIQRAETKYATPMKKRVRRKIVPRSKILIDDDDDDDALSDISISTTSTDLGSVVPREDPRATTNANRWTYMLTVRYREVDTDEKKTVRGTCFLVWDSRLNNSVFVTSKSLLSRAWEEQILSVKATNLHQDKVYRFTRRSVVFAGEFSQVVFLKIPAKKDTLEGFSLIDTRKVGVGGKCLFVGFGLGFLGSGKLTPDIKHARLTKKRGDVLTFDKAMDRGVMGGPVLTETGRLVGFSYSRDLVDEATSVYAMDFVFRQYLTYCTID